MNNSPRRETAGGFSLLSTAKEQSVLAKRHQAGAGRINVRYYLWSAEGLQRITQRFHRNLFDRTVALPQYARTKQKIVEVLIQRLTSRDYSISARGVVYVFPPDARTSSMKPRIVVSK